MMMPLAVSVTDGIALSFIGYALLKIATGRAREPHWVVHLSVFVARYVFLAR